MFWEYICDLAYYLRKQFGLGIDLIGLINSSRV
jgi:hypothetical protein